MPATLNSISPLPRPSPPPPPAPLSPPSPSSSSHSYNPSLLIIAAILTFVFIATVSIHLLLRFLSRSSSSSLLHLNSTSSSSTSTPSSSYNPSQQALIDSLPLFTLATIPRRPSVDCAVCLSRVDANDKLRLLPSCRHVFHFPCIDAWLRSTPSCPLCRSSIILPPTPPPPHPPPEAEAEAAEERGMGWLKEYVDRLASSASSSFSSLRFSAWGSRRFDGGGIEEGSWNSEAGEEESVRSESGYCASSYKWMARAVS